MTWMEFVLTILGSVFASSGFWACIQKWRDKHNANTRLLVGIAHDLIISKGVYYLERGDWITVDEYENLYEYLYLPYAEAGGNGSAKCVIEDIQRRLRRVLKPPEPEPESNDGGYLV